MCIDARLLVLARLAAMAGLFLACCCPGLAQAPKEPPPIGAVFSPDAGLLATTRSDAKIIIWEVATGKEKLRFDVEDRSFGIVFSPDGKVLATIGRTKPTTTKIWDVATGKKLAVIKNREGELAGLVFSGEHQCAAAANADGTVALWPDLQQEPKNVAAAVSKPTLSRPFLRSAFVFTADGKMVITGGWDGTVRVWDVQTGRERATLVTGSNKRGEFQTPELTLGADGKSIITVSMPFREPMGQCVVWDLTTFEETVSAKTLGADALHSVVTPPDGSRQALLVGKGKGTAAVVIRNPADGKQRVLCEAPSEKRLRLAFSRDGKKLLVIEPATATVWDLTNDKILMKELRAGPGAKGKEYCYPRLLSADGSLLIGQAVSGLVRIWDVGNETSRLDINVGRPSNLLPPAIAPDGRSVFAGDALWDAATGKIRARINHELPKSD